MVRTDRFNDLAEVRALRLRLKAERDVCADHLRVHWEKVKDKEFRRGLMFDAAADLLRTNNGNGALFAIANGVKMAGGLLPLVGPLVGGRKGLLGSRLFWTGLSLVLPMLVSKAGYAPLHDLWQGVRNGYAKARAYVREEKGPPAGP